jgi:hypothetical protein
MLDFAGCSWVPLVSFFLRTSITRVLEGEYGSVLLRTLSGFRPMRRQDVFSLHVVVAEEAIGGLGLCPIPPRLID